MLAFMGLSLSATAQIDTVAQGTCGTNLNWVLTGDSVLTISGSGGMAGYSEGAQPWSDYYDFIREVIIDGNVSSIGMRAFDKCRNLTDVTIPNSVTSIGWCAFALCISLPSITIPNSVTTIAEYAFIGCSSLTEIDIPNNVRSIRQSAFEGCSALTSITMYNSVENIGNQAFWNCTSLRDVYVEWLEPLRVPANAFQGVTTVNVNLHVPPGTQGSYNDSLVWQDFNIIGLYNEDDMEGLRMFLRQPSAQSGNINAHRLGLSNIDTLNWQTSGVWVRKVTGLIWNNETPKRLIRVNWGHIDIAGTLDARKWNNLTYFYLDYNRITALDISTNTALTFLRCWHNQLTELDVSANTALTILYCPDNQITEINLNTALTELYCGGNLLTTLDVRENVALTHLGVNDNQLTALDVSENTLLTYFRCDNNHLPLSDLFTASEILEINVADTANRILGTQTLPSLTIGLDIELEFTPEQNEFNDIYTEFTVTKNGTPALLGSDYSVIQGKITFHTGGVYTVKMTNEAIISNPAYPAEVIIGIEALMLWQIGAPNRPDVIAVLSNDTLTIRGSGRMQNFPLDGAPWFPYQNIITTVIIGSNVTSIGDNAFRHLEEMETASISNTVTYIGNDAFRGSGLTSIILPNLIDTISGHAFRDCGNLAGSLTIPNSLNYLGGSAFAGCQRLEDVIVTRNTPLQISLNPSDPFSHPFYNISLFNVNLHVPAGMECVYKAAPVWEDFNVVGAQRTITASAGIGGTIFPSGVQTIACGVDTTFYFTPTNASWRIKTVLVDGEENIDAVANGYYTFENIARNHIIAVNFQIDFCGGSGTESDPYQICTAEILANLAEFVNAGNPTAGTYYILTHDIDLSGYATDEGWKPIGSGFAFRGNFDGNNKIVQNLTINRPTENGIGLFGGVNNATIQNLGVENCSIKGQTTTAGLVAYTFNSTINNCYIVGNVEGAWFSGGLIGESKNNSVISNSYASGTIKGQCRVGGLVGDNDNSTIINCYSTGIVEGYMDVGGLVGYNVLNSTINNCYATGSVSGGQYVGGLVGSNVELSNITNCYSTGNIINGNTVGGLMGRNYSFISNCYTTGNVKGNGNVGGLVGENKNNATIQNCVAANESVTGSSNATTNRLVGIDDTSEGANIYRSNYALNSMIVRVGSTDIPITEGSNGAGTGKDTTTLRTLVFYNTASHWYGQAWSIDVTTNPAKIWRICDHVTLPYLQWEPEVVCPHVITATAGENGAITPEGFVLVDGGNNQTFNFTSDYCYHIETVLVDNVNHPNAVASGTYTFENVTENHTIEVTFAKTSYIITATAGENGSINADEVTVYCGENSMKFIFSPDLCYQVDQVWIDGVPDSNAAASGSYTFNNVTADHTIEVTFKATTTVWQIGTANSTVEAMLCGNTLIISGTGAMQDWSDDREVPWSNRRNDMRNVIIKNGVTTIGAYAFAYCFNLSKINCENPEPPTVGYRCFFAVDQTTCLLQVPPGSECLYADAPEWMYFKNILNMPATCISISGTIRHQDGTPLSKGTVELFLVQNGNLYESNYEASVGNNGKYFFKNIADGDYIVRARNTNASTNSALTYYGNVENWQDATVVTIVNNVSVNVDSADITLIPLSAFGIGNSFIYGYIGRDSHGLKKMRKGVNHPIHDEDVSLQSLQGGNWNTVSCTVTDSEGYFEFPNLPAGTYQVVVDIPGLGIDDFPTLEVAERDTIYIEYILTEDGFRFFTNASGNVLAYPNPTNGELRVIVFRLEGSSATEYNIYNLTGGRVMRGRLLKECKTADKCEANIDVSHLPRGVYFLRISNEVVKFIKN